MTTITALADLHGYLPPVPPADIVLLAGDLCPVQDHRVERQAAWLDGPFRAWLEGIEGQVVAIAGNHDWVFQLKPHRVPQLPWMYLLDKSATVAGLSIYGTPWQPPFMSWAFNLEESKLAEKWRLIPESTDILLLHGPPHGYGDFSAYSRTHTGSPSLTQRIFEVRPRLAVFGHIHEHHGVWQEDGMTLANVTLVDAEYRLRYEPMVFEV